MVVPGSTLCINTLLEWNVGGAWGWGEDREVSSVAALADRVHGVPA